MPRELMDEYSEKLDAILEWLDEKERDFDPTFVEDMRARLDNGQALSPAQMRSIDNIIHGFHIHCER